MARADFDLFIEQLKSRATIEDVVSQYVTLRRAGNRFVGLCPFHSEKTGSFTVYVDSQSYYCFGCGNGGDVITFIRNIEKLDYMDAVHFLADRYGMQVPEREGAGEYRQRRAVTLAINKEAARHFHQNLKSEIGKKGMEYFTARKLTPSTITRFGLGYAPDSWDDMIRHLTGKGFTKEQIETAGLALRGQKGGYYDRFRNRVIFPIIDTTGNVIAFGGRILESGGGAKYLNSPDTPVFKKSQVLFALNYAKNAPGDRLLLCEGYMDVISLHQAGFPFAVAPLGTAVTPEHARLAARYAKEIILCLDSDEAGQTAMNKAIRYFEETGIKVRILTVTGAKDPDEYIQKYGAQRFARLLDGSGSQISYLLAKERRNFDLSIPEDKSEYLKKASAVLAGIRSPVEREVYVSRVAEETGISAEFIRAEIKHIVDNREAAAKKKQMREEMDKISGARDRINPEKSVNLKAARAEEGLIAVLLKHPDYYRKLEPSVTEEDFVTQFNRNIFRLMRQQIEQDGSVSISALAQHLTTDEVARLTQYTVTAVAADNELRQACDYAKVLHAQGGDMSGQDPEAIRRFLEQNKKSQKRKE